MPESVGKILNEAGLRQEVIGSLQKQFGKNIFFTERPRTFLTMGWEIVKEPMFIILLVACTLYFVLGQRSEGVMMLLAMIMVSAISLYQEWKSGVALKGLKEYTDPGVRVIRDGTERELASEELVPGDIMVLEEGNKIPADAQILQANDLTVDESILTGESMPVEKNSPDDPLLFQGTILNSGKCYAKVSATGINTKLGKLGKTVVSITTPPTRLQLQINSFVKKLAFFGFCGFSVVCLVNYLHNQDLILSLLLGLTLAMSVIPEEVPVAFSSFMALGAYYLAKNGIITRQPVTIENLGSVTVICLDKTGTITKNKMEVRLLYDFQRDQLVENISLPQNENLLTYALLASETKPFDAMEIAITAAYSKMMNGKLLQEPLNMTSEYPLSGRPPMMTHVYETEKEIIVAAKGALERIMKACALSSEEVEKISRQARVMASSGNRLLGVASAHYNKGKPLPVKQDDFEWKFEGILAFYDPPKENVNSVLRDFYKAGITIKLLTGDFPETAVSIAKQTGIKTPDNVLTGEQVMSLSENLLKERVKITNIYARMFPEAKLKVIEALKSNGEITAMSGDGVNDGPALKSADIGIAMGKKGSEIARQAASLILTDDNLEKIVEAIRQGRKIYNNLKKATRYIVSIHIPILLTASVPLLLGWKFTNIFTPIHVIFLELIMGPTCSIFFEREPVERNLMTQPPRNRSANMFEVSEILVSVVQGLVIALCILGLNYFFMTTGFDLPYTRTILFTALIISNIFLTLVDRSFTETIRKTIYYPNDFKYYIIILSTGFLVAIHLVKPIQNLFGLVNVSAFHFFLSIAVGFASVMWFELYKAMLKDPVGIKS